MSLRGLRSSLPTIADRARTALHDGIEAELRAHEGKISLTVGALAYMLPDAMLSALRSN